MISDDENGLTRKKLRLTKEQSAYLEDSFKEHSTLNPVSLDLSNLDVRVLNSVNIIIKYLHLTK